MYKTFQLVTQCKDDINHNFKAKIINVFVLIMCKSQAGPLQDELLCVVYVICANLN